MNTAIRVTSELRQGDVVLAHGMRCLIDGEILVSRSHADTHSAVRYTQALVLNRDDDATRYVPRGWTADWQRDRSKPTNGEHRWTIQGNDLARWCVEVQA